MIEFHYQNDFNEISGVLYNRWLQKIAQSEGRTVGELSYVFCSDDYLWRLNKDYLDHDTYTDIITFDYSVDGMLHGEIYISTDRVAENAARYVKGSSSQEDSFLKELHRVMAHGLLHWCGYADKTETEQQSMRVKEEEKMQLFHVKP